MDAWWPAAHHRLRVQAFEGRSIKRETAYLDGAVLICPPRECLAGFEELAMPLFDSLYNLARWLSRNQNDAEDLVQETYLKALRSFASFQPGTNFRAWIFRILKNTFLGSRSKLEQRMTLAMDSEDDLPATTATPETLLIGRFDIDAARSAIEELPVIFREVDFAMRRGRSVLPGNCGNVVDPDRYRHVAAGQSPEDGSRLARRWSPSTPRSGTPGRNTVCLREPGWWIAESEKCCDLPWPPNRGGACRAIFEPWSRSLL